MSAAGKNDEWQIAQPVVACQSRVPLVHDILSADDPCLKALQERHLCATLGNVHSGRTAWFYLVSRRKGTWALY